MEMIIKMKLMERYRRFIINVHKETINIKKIKRCKNIIDLNPSNM